MSLGRSLRTALVVVCCALALVSIGCGGEPPEKEMQQAQTAIDTARAAGAERYALQELTSAERALQNAKNAVDQRDYRLALNHALDSRELAQGATKTAVEGQTSARQAADRAMTAATAALDNASHLLKAAEGAHISARILSNASAVVADAEARVQEARAAQGRGEFQNATSAASAARDRLAGVINELNAATAPAARRRRP